MSALEDFFKNIPLFNNLTEDDMKPLFQKIKEVKIKANEILVKQGTVSKDIYIIREGKLEIYITGPHEYIHHIDILEPPAVIGEMEFFDDKPLVATARAKTDCVLYLISNEDMRNFLEIHPELNKRLFSIALTKWRNVEDGIHQIITSMFKGNEYLSKFASTVSHDLKAPLYNIMGFNKLLKAKMEDQEGSKCWEYMNKIEKSVQKMDQLIKGIYKYSVAIQPSPEDTGAVDIKEVVDDVLQILNPPSDIKISILDPLPVIHINKTQMIQVFQNLLENAMKYLDKPEKKITIGCRSLQDFWEFSICDNGIGIKEEDYPQVMTIFRRVESNDNNVSGTGIGLAIVERIITLNGGKIWIESEYGKGTTIKFTLSKSMSLYVAKM
ncbi:MAG: ATP-binding protein [Candidatus Hodarchaeales archaeon]